MGIHHVKIICIIIWYTTRWGILSPYFFAIYIDSIVKKVTDSKIGCYIKMICMNILLYAGDIILLAPSVTALQELLLLCEEELSLLGMWLNVKKSACIRVGARFNILYCLLY